MDTNIYDIEFVDKIPENVKSNVLLLQKRDVDHVGTTYGSVWVKVYGENDFDRTALYKPCDPDEPHGAQAELISSHFFTSCFDGIKCLRVPKINMVRDNEQDLGIISYRVHDKVKEDFTHMDSLLLHYKYSEQDLSKIYTLGIGDILDCIREEVTDDNNYKEVEKAIIMVACADAVTNNADRHGKNWALIRDKDTNHHELAIFDNVKSFVNLIYQRTGYRENDLWSIGYIGAKSSTNISTGKSVMEYVKKYYPEYFDEFDDRFENVRKQFLEDIKSIPQIDTNRIGRNFSKKSRYFQQERGFDFAD